MKQTSSFPAAQPRPFKRTYNNIKLAVSRAKQTSSLTLTLEKKLVLFHYWHYIQTTELCTLRNNPHKKGNEKDFTEIIYISWKCKFALYSKYLEKIRVCVCVESWNVKKGEKSDFSPKLDWVWQQEEIPVWKVAEKTIQKCLYNQIANSSYKK